MLRVELDQLLVSPYLMYQATEKDGVVVATNSNGSALVRSYDGIHWAKSYTYPGFRSSGVFMAVKTNGTNFVATTERRVYVSTDGVEWLMVLDVGSSLMARDSLMWTGSMYVIVAKGYTYTSSSGITWETLVHEGTPMDPSTLRYCGGFFFVVSGNIIHYSSNLVNWTSSGVSSIAVYAVSSEGNYLVGGGNGGATVRATWANGATSIVFTSGSLSTLTISRVYYSSYSHLFVIFQSGGFIRRSTDGASWTVTTTVGTDNLHQAAMDPTGQYFIVVATVGVIHRSTDGGLTVTQVNLPISNAASQNSIYIKEGIFLLWGDSRMQYSSDYGATWSIAEGMYMSGTGGTATDGDATIVAGGDRGNLLVSKDSGATWSLLSSVTGTTSQIQNIRYLKGYFYFCDAAGKIYRSSDGLNWEPQTSNTTQNLYKLAGNEGYLVAVGSTSTIISGTGTSWTVRTAPVSNIILRDVCVAKDGKFVVIGASGNIWESTNNTGTTWVNISNALFTQSLLTVASDGNVLVAGYNANASSSVISTSTDNGRTWSSHYWMDRENGYPTNMHWDGERFICVTTYGGLYISYDGYEWHNLTAQIPNSADLYGATVFKGKILFVDFFVIYGASIYEDHVLVKDGVDILTIEGDTWTPISYIGNPTESDYIDLGINDISQLTKEVDFSRVELESPAAVGSGTLYRKTIDPTNIRGTIKRLGGR